MSYAIRYGQEPKQILLRKRMSWKHKFVAICIAAALLLGLMWPQGQEWMRQALFPWLNEMTVHAFSDMIQQIRYGTAIPVALTEFCREIIENAEVPV